MALSWQYRASCAPTYWLDPPIGPLPTPCAERYEAGHQLAAAKPWQYLAPIPATTWMLVSLPLARSHVALILVAGSALALSPGCGGAAKGNAPPKLPGVPAGIFRDVAEQSGVAFRHTNGAIGKFLFGETTPPGCALFDADGDGWLDLFVIQSGAPPGEPASGERGSCALYLNKADGTFRDGTSGSGLNADLGYAQGCAAGDVDNDGKPDLYVTGYGGNRLFRNLGEGRFQDATARTGVGDTEGGPHWATSAAFGDYDADGWLDLFVCHYCAWKPESDATCVDRMGKRIYCDPLIYPGAVSRLYRNEGKGRFRDVTRRVGLDELRARSLGAVWLDCDDDGRLDLYVANDLDGNWLLRNEGDRFHEVGLEAGASFGADGKALSGMGIGVGDYDNDGREDLYVTNFSGQTNSLYRNDGPTGGAPRFTHRTQQAGLSGPSWQRLGWGVAFLDYDRDGWSDLVVGNGHVNTEIEAASVGVTYAEPKSLYRNLGDGTFADLSMKGGGLTLPRVTRGLAVGDWDNDGRVDVVAANQNERPQLLRNESEDRNRWLSLRLVGTRSNRDGYGAKVTVRAGELRRFAECRSSLSYASACDPRLHFGLGGAERATVTIRWPSGRRETLPDLEVDRWYVCTEGRGCVVAGAGR